MAWKDPKTVTSKAELEEGHDIALDFGRFVTKSDQRVLPVIAQDVESGEVLVAGHANRAALDYALREKVAAFWSLSRDRLWVKGETSGNVLDLVEVRVNCEQNSLLYLVRMRRGGVCHTLEGDAARRSCYYRRINGDKLEFVPADALPPGARPEPAYRKMPTQWKYREEAVPIGFVSLLDREHALQIWRLRRLLETEYGANPVEDGFAPPHLTFQGTITGDERSIARAFREFAGRIPPFEMEVDGVGHFDEKVIYLRVRKTDILTGVHAMISEFLAVFGDGLFDLYGPELWVPHVTLAVGELPAGNFERAFDRLNRSGIVFTQRCRSLCLIGVHPGDRLGIVRKYDLPRDCPR